jgi:hypothetical protein
MKRSNSRGAKDPCRIDVSVRRTEYRLGLPHYGIMLQAETEAWTRAKQSGAPVQMPNAGIAAGLCMLASETIR